MFPAGVEGVRTRRVTLASGLSLRVAESGSSSAPPVLLLHGWGASLYMWRAWFAPLAAAGLRVIAPDLPGHGLSDRPDDPAAYRLDRQVAVVRELLAVEQLDRTNIVAQSMAGTIALELALAGEPRLRRLALVNPACFGRIRMQTLGRLASPPAVDVVLPWLVTRWVVTRAHRMVYGDPARITDRDEDEYWAPSQFPAYSRAMRRLLHEFSWRRPPAEEMAARLRTLTSPVLVVLGTRDRLVRDSRSYTDRLKALGAPLEIEVVAGGGHAVNEERPEDVVPATLRFFGAGAERGQHRAT
jgi:pimeloyl-ACP methyl ester carboxylesterase